MNQVNLVGRLVQDLTLRKTNDGNSFSGFRVAVNEYRGGKEYTNFIDCIAFGPTAENMARYVGKGSLVSINGRLNVRNQQHDGNYTTIVNVNVDRVEFLDSRQTRQSNPSMNLHQNDSPLDLDAINGFEQEPSQPESKSDDLMPDEDSILWD